MTTLPCRSLLKIHPNSPNGMNVLTLVGLIVIVYWVVAIRWIASRRDWR